MKKRVWLLLIIGVFGLGMLLFAQNTQKDKPQQMMGTICSSACVVQEANLATCDKTCTDKGPPAVFVSDSGKVTKIAEQDQKLCHSHMGKHVKMMAVPTEEQREQEVRIMQLVDQGP